MDIVLKMENIKNIVSAEMTLPFSKGLYAIVGENGCGKSTIMLAMSLMVKTSSAHMLSGDAVLIPLWKMKTIQGILQTRILL